MLEALPRPNGAPGWFPEWLRYLEYALAKLWDGPRYIRSVTASTTLGDGDRTILVDASGGAVTVTLPTANAFKGTEYRVKKIDASGNAVTIAAADTVDGAASIATTTQWASYTVQCNGAAWFTL